MPHAEVNGLRLFHDEQGEGETAAANVLGGAVGARDAVLGAGALAALAAGDDAAKPWLIGGVAADALDLAATLRNAGDLPTAAVAGVAAVAGGAAAAGLYALKAMD
jgi:hypothetical protein